MREGNGEPSGPASPPADPERERVARVLEQVRSGVRRRQAERTTVGWEGDELRLRLLELKQSEYVQEPPCVAPIPLIGPLIVFLRKAFARAFTRWYQRPILVQQNRFNQASGRLIQDLAAAQADLRQEIESLRALLEASSPGDAGRGPAQDDED